MKSLRTFANHLPAMMITYLLMSALPGLLYLYSRLVRRHYFVPDKIMPRQTRLMMRHVSSPGRILLQICLTRKLLIKCKSHIKQQTIIGNQFSTNFK